MTRDTVDAILFDDDGGERAVQFPARWEICPSCEGCGTDRGRSVECDGGGFTSSEWAEQDDEFKEDYLAGRYDRPCARCGGTGKVLVIDRDRSNQVDLVIFDQQELEDCTERNIRRMERLTGA